MDLPVHAFEKAGLGFARFRCVGMASLPRRDVIDCKRWCMTGSHDRDGIDELTARQAARPRLLNFARTF